MSKERFSVFATDVETGESRSTTQYLCVVCQERRDRSSSVHEHLKESSGQSEGMVDE